MRKIIFFFFLASAYLETLPLQSPVQAVVYLRWKEDNVVDPSSLILQKPDDLKTASVTLTLTSLTFGNRHPEVQL